MIFIIKHDSMFYQFSHFLLLSITTKPFDDTNFIVTFFHVFWLYTHNYIIIIYFCIFYIHSISDSDFTSLRMCCVIEKAPSTDDLTENFSCPFSINLVHLFCNSLILEEMQTNQ